VSGRGRANRWKNGEAFGTSLADILTTALGCVLLLFLAAVLNARLTLSREQSAHTQTRAQLLAEEEGRKVAEVERLVALGKQTAVEEALLKERAARGELDRALKSSENTAKALSAEFAGNQTRLQQLEAELAASRASVAALELKYGKLEEAARAAAQAQGASLPAVDLLLVVDATASMAPSLDAVRRDLKSLITALGVVSSSPRVGVAAFRDAREAPEFRVETLAPTGDLGALAAFLDQLQAQSTRADTDLPEWMSGGMRAAMEMPSREDALRLMVVVSDAADQVANGAPSARDAAKEFRARGGAVFVLSTVPGSVEKNPETAMDYGVRVLPEHAGVAADGGGSHLPEAGVEALTREVLRAVLAARNSKANDHLQRTIEELDAPAPSAPPLPPPSAPPP
jgi:hypothetical protein